VVLTDGYHNRQKAHAFDTIHLLYNHTMITLAIAIAVAQRCCAVAVVVQHNAAAHTRVSVCCNGAYSSSSSSGDRSSVLLQQ
jgi:hypothetical protein